MRQVTVTVAGEERKSKDSWCILSAMLSNDADRMADPIASIILTLRPVFMSRLSSRDFSSAAASSMLKSVALIERPTTHCALYEYK